MISADIVADLAQYLGQFLDQHRLAQHARHVEAARRTEPLGGVENLLVETTDDEDSRGDALVGEEAQQLDAVGLGHAEIED